jgi:hypothetical protein
MNEDELGSAAVEADAQRVEQSKWSIAKIAFLAMFCLAMPGMFLLHLWDWFCQNNRDEETAGPWGGLRLIGPIMGGNLIWFVGLLSTGYFYSWWLAISILLGGYVAIVLWFVVGIKLKIGAKKDKPLDKAPES